jgi:hypothetical protein
MQRLGAAIVELIRRIPGDSKFLKIEAATKELAAAIEEHWNDSDASLPTLAIASDDPATYGQHGLSDLSAAGLRSRSPHGACVVVCEGFALAERESILGFLPVAPGDLLTSKNKLMLLADAVTPVRRDGPAAAVREAIVLLPAGERPGAAQVSAYFDALASGADPMASLPILGGFVDTGVSAADVRGERIRENLALAASRRSADVVRPAAYADIRSRAGRVLARRPSGDGAASAAFMALLESGSDDLLGMVTFDEAREILAAGPKGLSAQVKAELRDYERRLRSERRSDASLLPWADYRLAADNLDRAADRRDAATTLLAFDATEGEAPFTSETRRKLRALLRDRTIRATPGSAPEVGLARAVRSLGAVPERLVLLDPHPQLPVGSQSSAREALAVACARIRLAGALQRLEAVGCEIDGILALEAFDGFGPGDTAALFVEAGLDGAPLPTVRLRLHGGGGSVEVQWAPDVDDYAMLRCVSEFADGDGLWLECAQLPEPHEVAAAPELGHPTAPDQLRELCTRLRFTAGDALRDGLRPERLRRWVEDWTATVEAGRGFRSNRISEAAAVAGCVVGPTVGRSRVVGMSPLAPLKAQWLADYLEAAWSALGDALASPEAPADPAAATSFDVACHAITTTTASHLPAFLRLAAADEPLLPSRESRVWSVFGGRTGILNFEPHALAAVDDVLKRLIQLQPEVAGHLRCIAMGPGAASLLLQEAVRLSGTRIAGAEVAVIEIFAIGPEEIDVRSLAAADEHRLSGDPTGRVRLRYVRDLAAARAVLGPAEPVVHFALMTGLTADGGQPTVSAVEIPTPELDSEVLFSPRIWQRPDTEQRMLLTGPGPTPTQLAWMRLAQAIDDRWPRRDDTISVPEMRSGAAGLADELRQVHSLAMWVATLDRYATRDSLERALGDEVAILHQQQRLGAESPIGLVVSQRAGGPVDRAIGRSLRQARIVRDEGAAISLGADLRRVAAQGYGILALEAATSGTGINELVGHVVGFAMLGTTSTPWPLPPGCRVVLVSLDEHPEWFLGQKRADLLALAIDTAESGLHGAVIEVKARRSDEVRAASEALDQLKRTLFATAPAAYPRPDDLATRVWLNRIAEAVYAVARESRLRFSEEELAAIEQFRRGRSTLEWAGVGLIFGPTLTDARRVHRQAVDGDWVPIAMHDVQLNQERLQSAVQTDLRELYTAETDAAPLGGGRRRRRPETGVARPERPPDEPGDTEQEPEDDGQDPEALPTADTAGGGAPEPVAAPSAGGFTPPLLGWDHFTGEPVLWRAAGAGGLSNGHVQIWGSSGAGKTQFVKMLLTQLSSGGTRFGIADFKNDYGDAFPDSVGAEFLDLWGRPGAPYNPLALAEGEDRSTIDARIIEFRDSIEQAMASYQRIGARQKNSIERALRDAYRDAESEHRWPTMLDLNRQVGDDIAHILGDLTRYEIFADGPSLGAVVDRNVVFGLNRIPGNGQTTVLAAAFLLSVVAQTMQDRPPVANTISYAMVVDEAHRVAQFKAIQLMLREGRSKGLAVLLATQAPSDLPETVDANAQTRICFRLSDAVIAGQAARKLNPSDDRLADRIRTLGTGEAFVSLQGSPPQLLTMPQHYRDLSRFEAGDHSPPESA